MENTDDDYNACVEAIIFKDELDSDGDVTVMEADFLNDEDEDVGLGNDGVELPMFQCSTCEMQFSSINEHIQEFHLGQEVKIDSEDNEEEEAERSQEAQPDQEGHWQSTEIEVVTVDRNGRMISNGTNVIESTQIQCSLCESRFETRQALSAHMRGHKIKSMDASKYEDTNEKTVNHVCKTCNTIFMSRKSLKLHARMHLPPAVKSLQDVIGPDLKTTSKKGDSSAGKEKFECPICQKIFDISFKEIHMESHSGEEKFLCGSCNITFASKETLDMHNAGHQKIRVIETKASKNNIRLPYACQYCGKEFSRPHEKVKHERIHTGEKPFGCEICGKTFRVAYCRTLHMRTHSDDRPYVCVHCNKRYKAQSVYNHHLLTHSDVRAFKCPFCPKTFKTQVQLSGHKNSHTKPFSCPECNRPFATLYALKVHLESHKRLQHALKHSCQHCGATYTRSFALKNHIAEQHPDAEGADPLDDMNMDDEMIEIVDNESEFDTDPIMISNTEVDGMIISEIEHFANEEIVTDWMK